MAITNAQIIFFASCDLMKEGKIKGTGRYVEIETDDGPVKMEEPEPIHTFQAWKKLGYSVKKGEKAITRLNIWKFVEKKGKSDDDENAEEVNAGHCIRKEACFFASHQVQPISVN